eukprot:m.231285 g.231285  ORF g.231285 m.231285 type:complete len:51 (+) comp17064_c6_seq1:3280-3432(+)
MFWLVVILRPPQRGAAATIELDGIRILFVWLKLFSFICVFFFFLSPESCE